MTELGGSIVAIRAIGQLLLIFLVAWGLGHIAERLGFTAVVGELVTGFVLGPSILGVILPSLYPVLFPPENSGILDVFGLLGLILLLGLVGLEIDVALIRDRLKSVVVIGILGMIVPFIFGMLFGLFVPAAFLPSVESRPLFSVFVATALSISAIPVIARVLRDLGIADRPVGQVTIAAAMFTDIIGWVLLSVIAGVARSGAVEVTGIGVVILTLGGFLLVAFTLGQHFVNRYIPRIFERIPEQSQFSLVVISILGISSITWLLGLEPAIGAFVVGIVFARGEVVSATVLDTFETMTLGVFAPILFAVAGLRADLSLLLEPDVVLISVVLIGIATMGKFIGVYAGATMTGSARIEALTMGIGLNARGAIEIVIATLGLEFGILTVEMYTVILVMAIATTVMTPPLLRRTLSLDGGSRG